MLRRGVPAIAKANKAYLARKNAVGKPYRSNSPPGAPYSEKTKATFTASSLS